MKEYYTTYGASEGLRVFATQKQALEHMRTANECFVRGVLFHIDEHAAH